MCFSKYFSNAPSLHFILTLNFHSYLVTAVTEWKQKKLDVMIFYKALWPVTRTTLISEFRWLLYAIALLSAISHLWDAFWWAKTHLEFQGFSPFCLWTKLHEHGWMTADASRSLVSCSGLTSLGPFPSGWLTNIFITGEIPFRFRLNVILSHFFLPCLFLIMESLALFLLAFFQLPVIKYFSKRCAQVLGVFFCYHHWNEHVVV